MYFIKIVFLNYILSSLSARWLCLCLSLLVGWLVCLSARLLKNVWMHFHDFFGQEMVRFCGYFWVDPVSCSHFH